jgi:hypothetical protein
VKKGRIKELIGLFIKTVILLLFKLEITKLFNTVKILHSNSVKIAV